MLFALIQGRLYEEAKQSLGELIEAIDKEVEFNDDKKNFQPIKLDFPMTTFCKIETGKPNQSLQHNRQYSKDTQ